VSPERTQAYRRVMYTLDELGPSKLLDAEQDRIRHAADNLIFASDIHQDAAQEALIDTELLCSTLVDSGRWTEPTAQQLAGDLRECGPTGAKDIAAAAA
jgi:hypothetical protein